MDSKKIRQAFSRFLGRAGLRFCSLMVKIMPGAFIYGFARQLARIAYAVAGRQRRIARESLEIAFGSTLAPEAREKIARDCFEYIAKSGVELFYLLDRPALLRQRVVFVNKQHLDEAHARKKGIILVSAHFGNFPLLLGRLSVEGYAAGGIMRPMRDAHAEKMFETKRRRFNIRTIYSHPRTVCVETTIRALRNNEIIFIPIDQNFGSGGVFVDFFGTKAATATGPVVLAQRTGAALIPCFIVRQPDDSHKLFFEPPLQLAQGATQQETVAINTQRLTDIIESYIRAYPAEWGWIHRRWKSRPVAEQGGV